MKKSIGDTNGDDAARSPQDSRRGSLQVPRWLIAPVATVVVVVAILVGVALDHPSSSASGTISVTGSGTVQGVPDTVSFQIGVQNVAASAARALTDNNARVRDLENSLLAHGVTRQDMQTSGLDIYANTNNQGAVTGFTVVNDVNVTMHRIVAAGVAIDTAVRAVGNGIELSGISFSISNQSTFLAEARVKAMQDARTTASQVARGGGASLGTIEKITDQENSTPVVVPYESLRASQGASSSVPLQAGSQPINVQVSVVYALNG
ncbi:MAG: SIMPL domain-containing protein [Acidobacteria bacterium]|nr:SIMPL domain-containing protein [Acidobacteriota bacterium]